MSGEDSLAHRSLLHREWPEGFDEEGRRLLAECPEFRLYELYEEGGPQILERSERIEEISKRMFFSISDAGYSEGRAKRVAWAEALLDLANMSRGTYYGGLPLLNRLVDTIGSDIAQMIDDPTKSAAGCSAAFRTALDALRRNSNKPEYLLIIHAEGYFAAFRERPTKSELIQKVEPLIAKPYYGKNARGTWLKKFSLAGLEELPD